MHKCHIVICGLPRSKQLFHILINGTILEKKNIERKMWGLIFSTTFVWNFSFQEELSEIWSKMYIGLQVKYPLFSSDFNKTWIFSTDFGKNIQISNFMKIRLVGAELLNGKETGRRTWRS
jgi:hypothetical protein